jgi:hypothetical protein
MITSPIVTGASAETVLMIFMHSNSNFFGIGFEDRTGNTGTAAADTLTVVVNDLVGAVHSVTA